MGWKEVQSLPPGAVKDVRLQIDCGTRGKAVRCELKTVSGSYMMTIEPQQVRHTSIFIESFSIFYVMLFLGFLFSTDLAPKLNNTLIIRGSS